jgi:hypothetical protein
VLWSFIGFPLEVTQETSIAMPALISVVKCPRFPHSPIAGVEFIAENGGGPRLRLRKGAEVFKYGKRSFVDMILDRLQTESPRRATGTQEGQLAGPHIVVPVSDNYPRGLERAIGIDGTREPYLLPLLERRQRATLSKQIGRLAQSRRRSPSRPSRSLVRVPFR